LKGIQVEGTLITYEKECQKWYTNINWIVKNDLKDIWKLKCFLRKELRVLFEYAGKAGKFKKQEIASEIEELAETVKLLIELLKD